MHELAISRAILATASRHAEGRPVLRISVSIGALRQVVPASLAFYFEIVARGTLCDGALLEPRMLPARLSCSCGQEWDLEDLSFACPRACGGQTTVLQGEELCLESIEVEEVACIARR